MAKLYILYFYSEQNQLKSPLVHSKSTPNSCSAASQLTKTHNQKVCSYENATHNQNTLMENSEPTFLLEQY